MHSKRLERFNPASPVAGGVLPLLATSAADLLTGVLEGAHEMIALMDLSYRFLAFSRAYQAEFEKVFGIEPKPGNSLLDMVERLPEEKENALDIWGRTLRGEAFTAIRTFGLPGRERRSYEIRSIPLRDREGRLIAGAHVAVDVTERTRNEEFSLRILENSQDCIKTLDLEGRLLSMNPGSLLQLEIDDLEPLLGQSWIGFWGDAEQPLATTAMTQARAGGIGRFQAYRPTLKGRPKWWDVSVSPIRDAAGQAELLLVISRDITEQKKIENELWRALEDINRERTFFRQVIDQVPGFIFVKDLGGRFTLANRAVAEAYATTPRELVGKTDADFNPNHDEVEHFMNDDREVILGRQGKFIPEEKVTDVHGGVHWVATFKLPLADEQGRYHQVLGVSSDISDRKKAEEALREANARLREADRRKDEFLAMLAHELRNPLAPIRNSIHVLRLKGGEEATRLRHQDIIDRQVTHMARLLDDLLEVSRITRGKIELRPRPEVLADVLAQAAETVAPLIERRRQSLEITPSPPALCVMADADRLAQVVGNLLTNAAKYTDEGGSIWLEGVREGSQAVIRVRDNGAGIAPEMLPRVFDLFAQADRTLGHAQGGLGIGLTLVQRLVQLHGGTVEAHSAGLGQGSEFIVRLPALVARDGNPRGNRDTEMHAKQP